jgi:hypothetical protein
MSFAKRSQLNVELLNDRILPSVTVLDLTKAGAEATAPNGAIAEQVAFTSQESSQISTFVSLKGGRGGIEQGYNTDARPLQFRDESGNSNLTHAITLGDVPVVTVNGTNYLEFYLAVNQKNWSPYLSLDEVQIFLSGKKNLSDYNAFKNTLNKLSPVFDLDSNGNVSIKLNSKLDSSGGWNAALLVPQTDFAGASPGTYLYLYSLFSEPFRERGKDVSVQWGVGPVQSAPTGASISGSVLVGGATVAIPGITVELQGTTSTGTSVNLTAITDANGNFSFSNLAAGTYSIIQEVPFGNIVVTETVGTVNGVMDGTADQTNSQFTGITLGAGQTGVGYIFGDSPLGG